MNVYMAIILVTILFEFTLSIISNYLNIRNLSSTLPEEFKGHYDEDKYNKSQEYTRVNTKFSMISSLFSLIILLTFWFAEGFNTLDLYIRSLGYRPLWTGVIFLSVLMIAKAVVSVPFSWYHTFVIEEKFGFNKTTGKTFLLDLLKGVVLSAVLGIPLLCGVLAFFEYTGELAWLYCWVGVTFFMLIVQYIAPTWIMPLFNKFTPIEDGELKETLMRYAQKVNFSLTGIFIIDGSKRSTKANAFFTGFGKNKRIALYDTLIKENTTNELLAILAHEVGHYKKKHIVKSMIIGIAHMGITLYIMSLFLKNQELFDAFFMENISIYGGLLFFSMLFSPIEFILSIVMNVFSRKNEYEADAFSIETTGLKEDFISALKKLSVTSLSNLTPHALYSFLNYSHPSVLERIEAIKKL